MPSSEGKIVRVKVRAGARKESFVEKEPGSFEIAVKEPAEDNRANRRVIELIVRRFGVPASSVRIRTGARSPRKTFLITEK